MHVALQTVDILVSVFDLLERKDLVRCARVGNCWFQPAIRKIWESADCWSDLIMGIWGSMELLKPVDQCASQLDFVREPTQEEWARFDLYASQARRLVLIPRGKTADQFTRRATNILSNPMLPSKKFLFQRLRSFVWYFDGPQLGASVLSQTPQLAELEFVLPSNTTKIELDIVWTTLRKTAPSLCSLSIRLKKAGSGLVEEGLLDGLYSTLHLYTKLERFRMLSPALPISLDAFTTLALLSSLRVLTCYLDTPFAFQSLNMPNSPLFPQLRTLDLHGPKFGGTLQDAWFPLKKLQSCSVGSLEADTYHQLIRELSSEEYSLQSLDLQVGGSIHYVEEFSNLCHLRSLRIVLQQGMISVSDKQMEQMASRLPLLQAVHICSEDPESSQQLTLLSVHHLVRDCKELVHLTLPFDATHLPPEVDVVPSPSKTFFYLGPHYSPIHNTRSVARWLFRCLSKHSAVNIHPPPPLKGYNQEVTTAKWDEVGRLIGVANDYRRLGWSEEGCFMGHNDLD